MDPSKPEISYVLGSNPAGMLCEDYGDTYFIYSNSHPIPSHPSAHYQSDSQCCTHPWSHWSNHHPQCKPTPSNPIYFHPYQTQIQLLEINPWAARSHPIHFPTTNSIRLIHLVFWLLRSVSIKWEIRMTSHWSHEITAPSWDICTCPRNDGLISC